MTASGSEEDSATSPPGGADGSQKSPTPSIGNAGIDSANSFRRSEAAMRVRRSAMLASTRRRSAVKPEYGKRGVPSIIHEPYSGCHAHASPKPSRRP